MRSPGDRDPYKVVGEATRKAIDAALAADVPPSSVRVLLAIVREMTTYTRLWDEITRATLARRAGIAERQATRALASLVDAGSIEWEPGNRFRWSVVSVKHHVSETSECPTGSGTSECPTSDDQRDISGQSAGHFGPDSGTSGCPTPGVTNEVPPAAAAEPDPIDVETHRRIREREAAGETIGHGLRKLIREDVAQELELDATVAENPAVNDSAMLKAAEAFGRRFATSYGTEAFLEMLEAQADWRQYPDVTDAAYRSFLDAKPKVS